MIFASQGVIKLNKIRKRAPANMYLFDDTVTKDVLRTKYGVYSQATECRSMTYSVDATQLKTVPISGVKGNRFFPVASARVAGFNRVASNIGSYFFYPGVDADQGNSDTWMDKYVTVQEQPVGGSITNKTANIFGLYDSAYRTLYDPYEMTVKEKFYLLPYSRRNLFANKSLIITPYFDGVTNSLTGWSYSSGTTTDQVQFWSSGLFGQGMYSVQNYLEMYPDSSASSVYGAGKEAAITQSAFQAQYGGWLFVAAQTNNTFTASNGTKTGGVYEGYCVFRNPIQKFKTSVLPHYKTSGVSDDPPCLLKTAAIRCNHSLGVDVILLDISADDSADLKQVGTDIADTATLQIKNSKVIDLFAMDAAIKV